MEELKAMFRVCVHIKKDGTRCGSPALTGGNFCFHHIGGSLREHTRARSIYHGPKLDFLYPGTRQAIQHNLYVVAQAMNDGNIELALANTYYRIFATCERNLRRFETLYQKRAEDTELLPVPEGSPDENTSQPQTTPATSHDPSEPDREPDALSPDQEPLELTPEEVQTFKDIETRYINDPSLADRIRDTYRQIYERRRAAKNAPHAPGAP